MTEDRPTQPTQPTQPVPDAAPEDTVSTPAPADQIRVEQPRGPAVGTLVWGLVTLAVAGLVLAREVADLRVDLSIALPVGMVALGVLLVVGAVVTGLRGRDSTASEGR